MKKVLLILAALLVSFCVSAEQSALTMPGDNRLVTFNYDDNNTYTVLTIPDAVTDIQLMKGERITAMAVGDSLQWVIAKTDEHVFIKPAKPNLFTSATLITDKRSYQLTLRSSPIGGKWYQRVSWTYPDMLIIHEKLGKDLTEIDSEIKNKIEEKRKKLESIVVSGPESKGSPIESMNFNYEITGNAPFKPTTVFDNGVFTYIGIPSQQEMPAFFIKNEKKYELVNYIRDGKFLKIQRLFSVGVLRLDDKEIVIKNKNAGDLERRSTSEYAKQTIPGY